MSLDFNNEPAETEMEKFVTEFKAASKKLEELQADAKRYRFIRDLMAVESSPGSWCLFDSAYKGSSFNEAIDKEMMGYE